ncbi:MAG: hypothetical protein N2448_03495 [Caloramator sp.]|nr:hypothetical protein [Caloramator sp.]
MDINMIQGSLNKIEGIINSKVVLEGDEITEVHILANNIRSPKQIVRDVESILYTQFDYKIDKNKISIAAIQSEDYIVLKRIRLSGVSVISKDNVIECSVSLFYDENEYSTKEIGINTAANRKKIVAIATVKTVEQILGQAYIFDIQDVIINSSNNTNIATVLVNAMLDGNEETLVGSAIIKKDINETIAKATLDAINRRIQRITL